MQVVDSAFVTLRGGKQERQKTARVGWKEEKRREAKTHYKDEITDKAQTK